METKRVVLSLEKEARRRLCKAIFDDQVGFEETPSVEVDGVTIELAMNYDEGGMPLLTILVGKGKPSHSQDASFVSFHWHDGADAGKALECLPVCHDGVLYLVEIREKGKKVEGSEPMSESDRLLRDDMLRLIEDAGKLREFADLLAEKSKERFWDVYGCEEPEVWPYVLKDLGIPVPESLRHRRE